MRAGWVFLLAACAASAQTWPSGLMGRWWRMPGTVEALKLTPDQQAKMDEVFQQNRVKLIDTKAGVDREEAIMDGLMAADPLEAAKVRTQIDRVAQARAELEKANANMLLSMRLLLTKEQWRLLQESGGHGVKWTGPPQPKPKIVH